MSSRADLVQQLQTLAQKVATDGSFAAETIAEQLDSISCLLRRQALGMGDGGHCQGSVGVADGAEGQANKLEDDGPKDNEAAAQPSKKQRRAAPREFDFSRYRTRYAALELMYVGWAFQGFARQDNTDNTIEGALFSALRKVKLVPEASVSPISELQYSRCGRTDRGVSALGQVVALRLRSCARVDEPEAPLTAEYDYPRLINKALPTEIRVLGWAPVPEDFNARFSAQYREYKYFIVQQRVGPTQLGTLAAAATALAAGGAPLSSAAASGATCLSAADAPAAPANPATSAAPIAASPEGYAAGPSTSGGSPTTSPPPSYMLDIGAMREAASRFIGEHDFRNFCKADVAAVRSFRRCILSFTVEPASTSAGDRARDRDQGDPGTHQVYAMTVRGTAFLWHQVRCMAAVLLMVGHGQERPEVVSALLDVAATPRKPQYSMAPEEPLLLYACGFTDLVFRRSPPAVEANLRDVAGLLHRHLIGAALTEACHARLAGDVRYEEPAVLKADAGGRRGTPGLGSGSGHIPLLRRQTEPSIEERMASRGIAWPLAPAAERDGPGTGGDDVEPMVE